MDTLNKDCKEFKNLIKAVKRGQRYEVEPALAAMPWLAKSVDETGWTALMWAARFGIKSCAKALLQLSDPLARNKAGLSALMHAADNGHVACVKMLIPVSDSRAKSEDGDTALTYAARQGHAACVELLLPLSDPLAVSAMGSSALMWAALCGHAACVELLLPVSDLSMVDRSGETALDMARRRNRHEVIVAFERHQAKLEAAEIAEHIGAAPRAQVSARAESRRAARL